MPCKTPLRRRLRYFAAFGKEWRLAKLAVALMLLHAAVPRVFADDPVGTNTFMDMTFEQLLEVKVDRVYGASRFEQKVSEAPASVSIVTADEIERFGHRTLADVLRSVRGLYVTYDRNYSYLGMRGFARPGDYNSRVLLLVDGHRMNENIYDSMYVATDSIMDVDLIDRVEVIRGPSSSIYGSSAFFGVINVVTKRGGQIDGVQTSIEAGSLGTYKVRATLGKKFTNDVELLVSGSLYESQGQDRIGYPEFKGPTNHFGVVRNSDEERAGTFMTSLSYHDLTLSGGFSAREKNVPTASYGTVVGDGREETLDLRGYGDLKFERAFTDDSRLTSRVFYDAYRYYGTYPYMYTPPTVTLYRDAALGDWAGTEWQWNQRVWDKHMLVLGVDYREDIRQQQINYDQQPRFSYLKDDRQGRNVGAFLQTEWLLRTNLIANVGARYDYFQRFGETLNPRAGLIYSPTTNATVKALYGRAFRAPNVYELHYYPATGDLHAETIDTYELVYEQKLPANLRFTTAAYYYTVDQLITQRALTANKQYFVNVDHADGTGVEFELDGRWPGILARVSYALQRTEDGTTGDELSNSPRHLAKLNLSVPLYADKFFAGLELQYNGGAHTVSAHRADDFVVVNLTLFSRKLARNLDVSASIYNLFDTKYGYPGAEDHLQEVITQDGRSFRVKLTYKF